MKKGRIYFNQSPKPTIGVEAELFTINKDTYELCPGAPLILKEFPESSNVKEELLECIFKVNANIFKDISSAINDLEKGMVSVI